MATDIAMMPTLARRDDLGDLVQWQLGPVCHTVADADTSTLDEMATDLLGPRRELRLHETPLRYDGTADPTAPGGLAKINWP